jgi:hypothetical protein
MRSLTAYPHFAAMALAAGVLLLPGSFAVMRSTAPDLSYENRAPSGWPIEIGARAVEGYQKFFEDRLGWRERFVALRNTIQAGIGLSPNPLARTGRNGWLLNANDSALLNRAGLIRFDDEAVRALRAQFSAQVRFWKQRNVQYYFLLGPDKSSIYPEQLDALFPVGETIFENAYRRHGRTVFGPRFVDPREVMSFNKGRPTYFRTDSHWNIFGARLAYREVMRAMAVDFPLLAPIPDSSYTIGSRPHKGDLVPYGLESSYVEDEPLVLPDSQGCGQEVPLGGRRWPGQTPHRDASLHTCALGTLNALVIHDSFGVALRPFFGRTFAKTLFVPATGELAGELVDEATKFLGRVDVIVQERVERAFLKGRME